MNYKQLADIWRSQRDQSLMIDEAKVIQAVRDEHRREERRLFWLNIQEVIPALILFLLIGWRGLFMETGRWAYFTAALLCLGVGLFLVGSTIRQRVRESAFGDSVKEQLRRAVSQVKHREWLYHNILWWYLLPIMLGWGVIVYKTMLKNGVSTFVIVYVAVAFAFFAWVYWMNRRVAVKRYGPRRKHLEEMLRDIESSEERASTT